MVHWYFLGVRTDGNLGENEPGCNQVYYQGQNPANPMGHRQSAVITLVQNPFPTSRLCALALNWRPHSPGNRPADGIEHVLAGFRGYGALGFGRGVFDQVLGQFFQKRRGLAGH